MDLRLCLPPMPCRPSSTGPIRCSCATALTDDERMLADSGAQVLRRQADAARARRFPPRDVRSLDHDGHGRAWASRAPDSRRVRRRGRELGVLWPHCARGGARGQWLPLGHERAVEPRHAPDLRLWQRGAAQEVFAAACDGRVGRLLRIDRAGPRLRSRLDEDAGEEGRQGLQAQRRQDVDHQLADRRRVHRLGQDGRRRHPRVHP